MKSLSSHQDLVEAIESSVAGYVDDVRRAAQQAVERSFAGPASTTTSRRRARPRSEDGGTTGKRRFGAELAKICETLHELVCSHPGEGLTVFADEMGLPLRALRPVRASRISLAGPSVCRSSTQPSAKSSHQDVDLQHLAPLPFTIH